MRNRIDWSCVRARVALSAVIIGTLATLYGLTGYLAFLALRDLGIADGWPAAAFAAAFSILGWSWYLFSDEAVRGDR